MCPPTEHEPEHRIPSPIGLILEPVAQELADAAATPPQATFGELRGLLPTLLVVDQADVPRDEGEADVAKVRLATRPAIAQAVEFFRPAVDNA